MDWNFKTKPKKVERYSRSPRGNVDWNLRLLSLNNAWYSRSPRGNVDWNNPPRSKNNWANGRSPRGNVDWNWKWLIFCSANWVVPHAGTWIEMWKWRVCSSSSIVVPHAGTWIEICIRYRGRKVATSFPTRERGLKWQKIRKRRQTFCRSPRGNVDWNLWSSLNRFFYFVVPHAGTRIEIVQNHLCQCWWGRSPRSNQYPCLLLQIVLNLLRNNRVAGWLTAILYRVKPMK